MRFIRKKAGRIMLSVVAVAGFTFMRNHKSTETYTSAQESASAKLSDVLKDATSWHSNTGTYIGAPVANGTRMAAGDANFGVSALVKWRGGEACAIGGDLGKGLQIVIADNNDPCTSQGVSDLQSFICKREGIQDRCPQD
jgi:hypothetical protein